jgi:prevent-host-death family protein
MGRSVRECGVEQARKRLSALLDEAAQGKVAIITKHGKPLAALVPLSYLTRQPARLDVLELRGSGKGLWGRSVCRTVSLMRDEWD